MKTEFDARLSLRFRKDGTFRILTVSDFHAGVGYDETRTVTALRVLTKHADPDLVMFLGDICGPGKIHVETEGELRTVLDGLTDPLESAGIPWAHVYGNHDDNFGLSNAEQEPVYESYPHCVSKTGMPELWGVSNYILPVYDNLGENILYNLIALDSHGGHSTAPHLPQKISDMIGMPDADQIAWYMKTSRRLETIAGRTVPAVMFLHIPLPEYRWVAENREESGFTGNQFEEVSASSLNTGLFSACLTRGDVRAVVCGHDHENDFSGIYCGVTLAYDGFLSYHACHRNELRGGRLITLYEDGSCETSLCHIRELMGTEGDSVR